MAGTAGRFAPRSLTARVLGLAVPFALLAAVLVVAPSLGAFHRDWLTERLHAAYLASLAIDATPDGMVDPALQRRLLDQAGSMGIVLRRADGSHAMLGPDMPIVADGTYDLRRGNLVTGFGEALLILFGDGNRRLSIIGHALANEPYRIGGGPLVQTIVPEPPLRQALRVVGERLLLVGLGVGALLGLLLTGLLQWQLVRPMRRLTASMLAFRDAPEDQSRRVEPSLRADEIGEAERALATMQQDVRTALAQKNRLAALGSAVTRINHDLRGTLSSAILLSDRLAQSGDPEVRKTASTIVKALDRAVALCRATLDFARHSPPQANVQPVRLASFVDELAAEVPDIAWRHAIPNDVAVQADPQMLSRVLCNLARNAAQAGAQTVSLSAQGGDGTVSLAVADDGPGLPAKAQAGLFLPFIGAAKPGGSGLGLAIARELMMAQGGAIELEESGSAGTRFRLILPTA